MKGSATFETSFDFRKKSLIQHRWRMLNAEPEDDPLAIWCGLIQKLQKEQSTEELTRVLRECTLLYTQDDRYKYDERLVQIWMSYISVSDQKLVSAPAISRKTCFVILRLTVSSGFVPIS
jgi:hypothetical protein